MTKPIEFGKFYALIKGAKDGKKEDELELVDLVKKYSKSEECDSAFDELGKIFCNVGLQEVYKYTGLKEINIISKLEGSVWKYLELRMGVKFKTYLIEKMKSHSREENLIEIISNKWGIDTNFLEANIEALAVYISEGIVEIIY